MRLQFLQEQALRQQQVLAPQLQQSLKILQMSMSELTSYLYEASLENPIIDLDSPAMYDEAVVSGAGQYRKRKTQEVDSFGLARNTIDWIPDPSTGIPTLQHSLWEQLPPKTPQHIRQIFHYMILFLDEKGYLSVKPELLASELQISTEWVTETLKLLQAMDPAGIGAKDLRECLLLQLEREKKQDEVAIRLVSDFLPMISEKKYSLIAKQLHISKEKVQQAVAHIQKLNPIPANGYTNKEHPQYIVPDIMVSVEHGQVTLHFNRQYLPILKTNAEYLQLMDDAKDDKLKNYIHEKFQEYKILQTAVQQRENTLVLIVSEIAKIQRTFLLGPQIKACLQPLSLVDLAERTGLSVSTISRALQDKYIYVGSRVYPLKYFLVRSLSAENDIRIGTEQVKALIVTLIKNEDKRDPLSDQAIAEELMRHNIQLSRRGVAKYRKEMSIPGMFDRKQFREESNE